MKKTFVFIILSLFLLGTYNNVFADYKIILKNGGKFIVNDYRKEGNSIKFYTPNGEIEIDQSNIESIKETESEDKTEEIPEPKPIISKTDTKNIVIKEIESQIKKQSDENKTKEKEIVDKHKDLTEKEKKLKEESKQLNEDINKEGRLTSIRKKRELDQRSKELKQKIDEYKKEVGDFSQEQNKNIQ